MKKIFLFICICIGISAIYIFSQVPSSETIKGCLKTSMFDIDLCPKSNTYVPLKNISTNIQKAIISTEDGKFYSHNGFDSEGIELCLAKIKEKGHFVCGGSTITQQLAKNMFLSKDKNLLRKGTEALITLKIENTLSKREILEKYLNVVQFGKNIFGIKKASQFYFKKSPANLDVVESAFLAMVLPSPEKYSQSYYRKDLTRFARRRITTIIENMYQYKMIPDESYITALARIDSFLLQGNATVNAQPTSVTEPVLTEEELDAITTEL
ncbi:MAG: monofunctional biosynthetic peptidoglycan transglycosylase [Moraxellaceae bacterium]|nr:monofunctional biosynthetic peptidoglycan transglycosylase [Pseudobdellovibrionaceae bacterium]